MKIYKWSVDMDEMELTNYVYRELAKEAREVHVYIVLILLAIFFGIPALILNMVDELLNLESKEVSGLVLGLLVVIAMLTVSHLSASFKACYFYKALKNKGMHQIVPYLYEKNPESEYLMLCYILLCKEFKYAYMTENKHIVVVYNDIKGTTIFQLHQYEKLCNKKDDNITLSVTKHGIKLISYDGSDYRITENKGAI